MQLTRPDDLTEDQARIQNKLRQEFFTGPTQAALEKRMDERLAELPGETLVRRLKVGRNHSCPCGSGRKFKKCCMNQVHGARARRIK